VLYNNGTKAKTNIFVRDNRLKQGDLTMSRYTDAYSKFIAKYDLDLNIKTEYEGATSLAAFDDFVIATSQDDIAKEAYISTLSSALVSYINKKVRIEPGKKHDTGNINLGDFVTEFDKLIDAIRTDEAEAKNTEYQHVKFEDMPMNRVINEVWDKVAPSFNKTLPTMWKDNIRSGKMKIDDMKKVTNGLFFKLSPIDMEDVDKSKLQGELTSIVAAYEAMKQVRETRKGFFGFFWRMFHRVENEEELNYLSGLTNQIDLLMYKEYDVSGVTSKLNGKNILGQNIAGAAKVQATEQEEKILFDVDEDKDLSFDIENEPVFEKKISLGDQVKKDITEVSTERSGKIEDSPALTDPNKHLV
jgi:hypothetical protein